MSADTNQNQARSEPLAVAVGQAIYKMGLAVEKGQTLLAEKQAQAANQEAMAKEASAELLKHVPVMLQTGVIQPGEEAQLAALGTNIVKLAKVLVLVTQKLADVTSGTGNDGIRPVDKPGQTKKASASGFNIIGAHNSQGTQAANAAWDAMAREHLRR